MKFYYYLFAFYFLYLSCFLFFLRLLLLYIVLHIFPWVSFVFTKHFSFGNGVAYTHILAVRLLYQRTNPIILRPTVLSGAMM